MQQLHSILLAPTNAAKNAQATGAGEKSDASTLPQAAQKFARHLTQLTDQTTEQVEQRGARFPAASNSLSAQSQSTDTQAVSVLARTMLETSEHEDSSADEAWLTMVEELNLMASGDLSLQELSSRHGIDATEMETQLNQALAEFDGDMRALVAQLQQVSGGNDLPPASYESSLERAVAESDSIAALLKRIKDLSTDQQTQFAADVNELMAQFAELDIDNLNAADESPVKDAGINLNAADESPVKDAGINLNAADESFVKDAGIKLNAADESLVKGAGINLNAADETIAKDAGIDQQTAAQLAALTDTLERQIQSLVDSDIELSQQQSDQLDEYLVLLDKLSQLPLHGVFSDPKSTQQLSVDLEQQDLPALRAELAEFLTALQALFSGEQGEPSADLQAQLQTVDMNLLQSELNQLLDTLDKELDGLSRSELVALLQSQLQALEGLNLENAKAEFGDKGSDNLARMNQLLSDLNHKLELAQADIRVIDASRNSEPGNSLPPVAQALAQASQQMRTQIQTALQLQQQDGDMDEADAGDFDNLRRLLSESLTSTNEPRTNTSQTGAGLQNIQQGNLGQPTTVQHQNLQRAAEQPAQSASETARQAQQAIDILGTGASERLRERVSVMFNTRTQAAEMRLDPPDLGRLSIRLNMNQEQATVSFQVTTPQAREALEQSLPRLREMLAEQGIQLADANVSEQRQNGSREASTGQRESSPSDNSGLDESDLAADGQITVESPAISADGRVDYFV